MSARARSTLASLLMTWSLSSLGCVFEENAVVSIFPALPVSGFLGSEDADAGASTAWRRDASHRLGCDPCDTWIDESSGTEYVVMPKPIAWLSSKEIESARLVTSIGRDQETRFTIILVLTPSASSRLEAIVSQYGVTLNRFANRSESVAPFEISHRWYSVARFRDQSEAAEALKSLGTPYTIEEEIVDVQEVDRQFEIPQEPTAE